jgi:hypothetical protein
LPIEDPKLDSLRPGSRETERGRWEGQSFQLKEVQRLDEEEEEVSVKHNLICYLILLATCFDPIGSSSGLHYEPINVKRLRTSLGYQYVG